MATATANVNPANAAIILSQFDQKTQIQALEMLRQLNAQQQLQQYQQLQHLRDLQHQAQIHARAAAAAAQAKQEAAAKQQQTPKFSVGPDGEKFQVPDDELVSQIVFAAEHYFSDENLIKDHYLLRQICQKSEGFLSLKLLTALKTIKRLTKDWRVTSYSLDKASTALKLNAEKTKVKRIAVLPEHVLNARQITSVIAIKIPLEFSSVRQITQMFAEFGKISLVRVLMPGRQVPCDLRNYATQVPDMGNTLCAIVEYETEAEACFACRELNNKRYDSGLRSALLGPRLRRNLYKSPQEMTEADAQLQITAANKKNTTSDSCGSSVNSVTENPLKSKVEGGSWSKVAGKPTGKNGKHRDSGCETASSHSSGSQKAQSPVSLRKKSHFDRAPGAGRKSVKMNININSSAGSNILRQPRGPTNGAGFALARTVKC